MAFLVPCPQTAISGGTAAGMARGTVAALHDSVPLSDAGLLAAVPSGKVDRQALKQCDTVELDVGTRYRAPRTATERTLTEIWQNVLGRERVGIRDNFFDLGGQSLLAIRLMARIEEVLGVKLPISTLFRAGTIELMAMMVDGGDRSCGVLARSARPEGDECVVALQPRGRNPPIFVVPGLANHVMSLRDLASAIGDEQPVYGLQPNDYDIERLDHPSLEELARPLIENIKRVAGTGPYHLAGLLRGGCDRLRDRPPNEDRGRTVGLLGLIDTSAPGFPRLKPLLKRLVQHCELIRELPPREALRYAISRMHAALRRAGPSIARCRLARQNFIAERTGLPARRAFVVGRAPQLPAQTLYGASRPVHGDQAVHGWLQSRGQDDGLGMRGRRRGQRSRACRRTSPDREAPVGQRSRDGNSPVPRRVLISRRSNTGRSADRPVWAPPGPCGN